MSEDLIKKACEWIDNPKRDYDEGVLLYSKLGKNRNLMRVFDRKEADKGMHILLYNLEKVTSHKFKPGKKELSDDELKALFIGGKHEGYDYFEAKRLVKLFNLKPEGRKKEHYFAAIANGPKKEAAGKGVNHIIIEEGKGEGRIRIKKNPNVNYEDLPDDLKKLFDANGKLEGEKKTVHAKMTALGPDPKNDAKRKEFADLLLKIEDSQAANWKVIDTWWNNKDKNPEPKKELSPEEKAMNEVEEKNKLIERLKSQASRRASKLKKMSEDDPDREKTQKELDERISKLKELGYNYKPRK